MTLLSLGLLLPHDPAAVSWLLFARNLSLVTLGNVIGGALFVALPYWAVARSQQRVAALAAAPAAVSAAPPILRAAEG